MRNLETSWVTPTHMYIYAHIQYPRQSRQGRLRQCYWTAHLTPQSKTVTGDKEGHYMMIKWPIQQEDVTFVNIYTPDIRAHK